MQRNEKEHRDTKKTQSYSLSNSVFLYKNQRLPAKILFKHLVEIRSRDALVLQRYLRFQG